MKSIFDENLGLRNILSKVNLAIAGVRKGGNKDEVLVYSNFGVLWFIRTQYPRYDRRRWKTMATRNTKAIATLRIWFGEIGSVAGWPITYRSEYIAPEFEIY